MTVKWIGAVLIILAGGGFGFLIAHNYKLEEWGLQQIIQAADFMTCELQCRLTPLPELCEQTALQVSGSLRAFFQNLAAEFAKQTAPDAQCCVETALAITPNIPKRAENNLRLLGKTLGRFDLNGQLNGLSAIKQTCQRDLLGLQDQKDLRIRSYQTLGFCTGAALVILFV